MRLYPATQNLSYVTVLPSYLSFLLDLNKIINDKNVAMNRKKNTHWLVAGILCPVPFAIPQNKRITNANNPTKQSPIRLTIFIFHLSLHVPQ